MLFIVRLDDEDEDVDVEPSDAGWQDDRNVVVLGPLDDPQPNHCKLRRKGS